MLNTKHGSKVLDNGHRLFWETDADGNRVYHADVGGGLLVEVYDTSNVYGKLLVAALATEDTLRAIDAVRNALNEKSRVR